MLTTVVVALPSATIQVGQTTTASASGLDQSGAAIGTGNVSWSSAAPAVASVTASGVVSGLTPGQAQIIATAGGKQGQQPVTVIPVPVASVTVTPGTATLAPGGTQQLTATTLDASGTVLTGRAVAWGSSDQAKAIVSQSGLVTAVAAGSATITATSEGKSSTATITVTAVAVALVTVSPSPATVAVGATVGATATAFDAAGNVLTGRVFAWTSGDPAIVAVAANGSTATLSGVSGGTATVTATSEGKLGTTIVTVTGGAQACSGATAVQLAVGQALALSAAQKASLCLGGSASPVEYVLIPFNNSAVAAATAPLSFTATNTSTILTPPLASTQQAGTSLAATNAMAAAAAATAAARGEASFRARERRELAPLLAALARRTPTPRPLHLTGISATPAVGSTVSLNGNVSSALCGPKVPRTARVVYVGTHTIVFVDAAAPAGGYTDAELTAFGAAFNDIGYDLDVANFGAPTDIDANARVGVFFTPMVNQIPVSAGFVAGLQTSRDLLPLVSCPGSNEGEMFYLAVPDPASSNAGYRSKTTLGASVAITLVHEFQHMINAGRRLYVNNAFITSEEIWLNEGLSHIAEELLYYRMSGNSPRTNIDLPVVLSTQAQTDAINTYQVQNMGRLRLFMLLAEQNSPYAQNDALETRGAIWQLLRYAADRKGGTESGTWFALANSTTAGQANFNAVFGDITAYTRDWTVAQFIDDAAPGVASNYMNPSWNFRSMMPPISSGVFPLQTRALAGAPVNLTLNGGSAAYLRFRVAASVLATVAATSSGLPVPSSVDFILVRTQ